MKINNSNKLSPILVAHMADGKNIKIFEFGPKSKEHITFLKWCLIPDISQRITKEPMLLHSEKINHLYEWWVPHMGNARQRVGNQLYEKKIRSHCCDHTLHYPDCSDCEKYMKIYKAEFDQLLYYESKVC